MYGAIYTPYCDNMKISTGNLTIQGSPLKGSNPLPLFRDKCKHKTPGNNGTLLAADLDYLGYETGFRILPYTMQDQYTRQKQTLEPASIVMENEYLRAEFLPGYGGRLYSLFDKKSGKELLFRNPILQPANLAIRNAWFSGGIEWNIAQLGHTFSTCDDVFFAKVCTKDGYEFVRMYDYERTRGLQWQIDFHLPDDSKQLHAHMVIQNDQPKAVPMYWWTNIAVAEKPGCRVFSATKEVLYIEPLSMTDGSDHSFGRGELPNIPVLPDADASYSLNFPYASEYFFQNSKEETAPWEAITYPDGSAFFERSTAPLRVRKMFCWGSHSGGRHWCDYLSVPGKGDYLEIQAGLSPTQLHGMELAAKSSLSFTQSFGSLSLEPGAGNHKNYDTSQTIVRSVINATLPSAQLAEQDTYFHSLSSIPCSKMLYSGHGWGALENLRRTQENLPLLSDCLSFPTESFTEEQYDWLMLLQKGTLPELEPDQLPVSWITDPCYIPYLEAYLETHQNSTTALLYLGTILYENDHYEEGISLWKQALHCKPLPILYRNLAYACKQDGNASEALAYMEQIPFHQLPNLNCAFLEEYFLLLLANKEYDKTYSLYHHLPNQLKTNEHLQLLTCEAAIELDEFDFLEEAFQRDYAQIREGESGLTDIWFRYVKKKGLPKEAVPKNLDLRMVNV